MNVEKKRRKLDLKFKKKGYEKAYEDENIITYSFIKQDENNCNHKLYIHKVNGIYFIYIEISLGTEFLTKRYASSIPKDINNLCLKIIKLKRKGW